jgi:formamidopyrimidine-DNA glycosylase
VLRDALDAPGRHQEGEAVERLRVYGREGEPCARCGAPVRRVVQAGRSTYFCARCQRR